MVEQRPTEKDDAGQCLALSMLAERVRWVTWRNELRNGKQTKVPYSPRNDRRAKADDPATWGTRTEAEAAVARLVNGSGGGIGLQLGLLGDDLAIGGIDLDTCRAADGTLEPWAVEVVARIGSYAEVSPSGTGAKVFFIFSAAELASLRAIMGKKPGEGSGRKWARDNGDHPPSIELYLDGRYFALTGQTLPGSPNELRAVTSEVLTWLIREAGPAFIGKSPAPKAQRSADSSRSAVAFRKGIALRSAGRTYDQMVEALRVDPETADWCREKGGANDGRELRRIWDKAADCAWLAHCQCSDKGNLRSNLVNVLVALREAPALDGMFAYDDMQRVPILTRLLSKETFTSRPVRDEDVTALQEWLQRAGLTNVSKDTVHQAVDLRSRECAFHPVRDYLTALRWDGTPRLATWLNIYLGAKPDAYAHGIGPLFLIAMVARIFKPGCKGD